MRRGLIAAGLAIFVAVDVLLVAMAFGWGRVDPATSAPGSVGQPDEISDGIPEAASSGTHPTDSQGPKRTSTPRLLSVVSEAVAWRSEGGSCDDRGSLELSMDGGETWGAAYPADEQLGRPLWLSGADYTAVQSVIASGPDCELSGVRTFDSGASWERQEQVVTNSAMVDPTDSSVLVWGGEDIAGPCESMSKVAVTGGVASVVCDDGSLWSVSSDSTDWTELEVQGTIALAASDRRWVAATESPECNGLGLVELDESSTELLACAPAEPDSDTALDMAGDTLWLWAGDEVLISSDGGSTFN